MIKISEAVADIVSRSFEASVMLQQGCLNLSAYAKRIRPEIEERTKKEVQTGSIVIALSRLAKSLDEQPSLLPPPTALEVSARSGLMEVVFERTRKNLELFHSLRNDVNASPSDFFMTTQGIAEITLIIPEDNYDDIKSVFAGIEPKFLIRDLSGLTLRTTEKDIFVPNVFFSILYPFAMRRFNIIEVISTFTEITMLVEDKDLQDGFEVLKSFLKK